MAESALGRISNGDLHTHLLTGHQLFAPLTQLPLQSLIDLGKLGVFVLHQSPSLFVLKLLQLSVIGMV